MHFLPEAGKPVTNMADEAAGKLERITALEKQISKKSTSKRKFL